MRKRKRPDAPPDPIEDEREGKPSSSGFDAEFRCPGKRALCARLPKEEDTAVTERGKRIHHALETNDFSDLNDTEQRTTSRIAYGESEIVHEYSFEGAQVTFEYRVWDFEWAGKRLEKTWSGRVDRFDWQPSERRLLVLDDKSGWTIPPPIQINWQVRSEGALLADELDAREAVIGLIHPHHPDSLWEARVYNREQLNHLLDVVRANVRQLDLPNNRRIPGPIQCQWCPAKGVCPEYIADAAKLDDAIEDEVKDEGFTAINARSSTERGAHVQALKARIKNIEILLKRYTQLLVLDESAIAGWRVARKLTRYFTNEARAIEDAEKEFGRDTVAAALKMSIPSLEEAIKAEKDCSAKEAKAAVQRVLGHVIRFRRGDPYMDEARSL